MKARVHKANIGTAIQFTIVDQDGAAVDLTGNTSLQIIAIAPSTARKVWTATVVGLPTFGVMQFVTTLASDIDEAGAWKLQPRVVIPSGNFWGDVLSVKIEDNI